MPLASADIYYTQGLLAVFVDGPVHDQDHVQGADGDRHARLNDAGYAVLVIRHDAIEQGLEVLARRLGVALLPTQVVANRKGTFGGGDG